MSEPEESATLTRAMEWEKQWGNATLKAAKEWLRARFEEGVACPCCNQFVKRYKRKLNSSMARNLLVLYRASPDGWLHVPNTLRKRGAGGSNDGSLLRLWGLLERQPTARDDGTWRNGCYRLTDLGRNFALGIAVVPRCVLLYNQEVLGFSEDMTTIRAALGSRFDYAELMSA